jgi:hypothetical protein
MCSEEPRHAKSILLNSGIFLCLNRAENPLPVNAGRKQRLQLTHSVLRRSPRFLSRYKVFFADKRTAE